MDTNEKAYKLEEQLTKFKEYWEKELDCEINICTWMVNDNEIRTILLTDYWMNSERMTDVWVEMSKRIINLC